MGNMRAGKITVVAAAALALIGITLPAHAQSLESPESAHEVAFRNVSAVKGLSSSDLAAALAAQTGIPGQGQTLAQVHYNLDALELAALEVPVTKPVMVYAVTWKDADNQPMTILGRSQKNGKWGEWESLTEETVAGKRGKRELHGSEPWAVIGAQRFQAVVVSPDGKPVPSARLSVIDPGQKVSDFNNYPVERGQVMTQPTTVTGDGVNQDPNADTSADENKQAEEWRKYVSESEHVDIHSRDEWGADPSWMDWPFESYKPKVVVVHHTAGANNYTPEQVPAIIRGIYRYHAVTLGWGDAGYHVFVDNFGRAWQGRAGSLNSNIQGGHVWGINDQAFGISVLGTYQSIAPSPAAIDTVAKIAAWKLKKEGINPQSVAHLYGIGGEGDVPVVMGHRDAPGKGGKTSCPGQAFYNLLPELREKVVEYTPKAEHLVGIPVYSAPATSGLIPMRYNGIDRVVTSVVIGQAAFPQQAKRVYLARSDVYADALSAGSLTDGPIILVPTEGEVSLWLTAQIRLFNPSEVVALGGPKVISDWRLAKLADGRPTSRIYGKDRISTSVEVAKQAWKQIPNPTTIFLAEASQGIDAVAAGSLTSGPVVLVPRDGKAPQDVVDLARKLHPQKVVALGGKNAVSDAILQEIGQGAQTERIAGKDRIATSLAISAYQFPAGGDRYYLANANNPVDAVAGGVLRDGPIVLVPRQDELPESIAADITRVNPLGVTALGGTLAVREPLLDSAVVLVVR